MVVEPAFVANVADVVLTRHANGRHFEAQTAPIGRLTGAEKLGCRLVVVPPGKRAWPRHCHHANEEMFVILEGTGTLRYGEREHPLRPGDVATCRSGGATTAHQIVNTSEAELRYLAISTMIAPDVMEYPDSGKFGVVAGSAPGGNMAARSFEFFGRATSAVDYHDGED